MYICIEIKKTKMKYTCTTISQCILTLFLFGSLSSNAQPAGWTYKVPVQVTNGSAAPRINYQELITINTQIPIAAGNMLASGNDIRFIDSCGSVVFQHWVESGINTPATKIWVMIPSIPASSTVSFWLFYGNPSAVNTESFPAVFPAAFITGGSNVTLTGTQTYDWFRIDASDTLFIQAGAPLTINARNAVINGVVTEWEEAIKRQVLILQEQEQEVVRLRLMREVPVEVTQEQAAPEDLILVMPLQQVAQFMVQPAA